MRFSVVPIALSTLLIGACITSDPGTPSRSMARIHEVATARTFPARRPAPRAANPKQRTTTRRPPSFRSLAGIKETWYPRGGRISSRWRSIVVHHSATRSGNAAEFDRYHRSQGWDELGYHFVIGNGHGSPDGKIEIGSRWHKQKHGAHCKTVGNYYNEHGIGICLVGDFTKSRPTAHQLASLQRLVRFLRGEADIALSEVTTHGRVTRRTACPGRHFSLAGLRRAVRLPARATSLP